MDALSQIVAFSKSPGLRVEQASLEGGAVLPGAAISAGGREMAAIAWSSAAAPSLAAGLSERRR
jgi:hypothetical protein